VSAVTRERGGQRVAAQRALQQRLLLGRADHQLGEQGAHRAVGGPAGGGDVGAQLRGGGGQRQRHAGRARGVGLGPRLPARRPQRGLEPARSRAGARVETVERRAPQAPVGREGHLRGLQLQREQVGAVRAGVLLGPAAGEQRRGAARQQRAATYHQTVESRFSISSTGRV
jgi:hypothetical protein